MTVDIFGTKEQVEDLAFRFLDNDISLGFAYRRIFINDRKIYHLDGTAFYRVVIDFVDHEEDS